MKLIALAIAGLVSISVGSAASLAGVTSCSPGFGVGTHILKAPVSVGKKDKVDAEVSVHAGYCPATAVHAVVIFSDATTKTVATNRIVAPAQTKFFTKKITVTAGMITTDPTFGPVMRITTDVSGVSGGVLFSQKATYTVAAT